MTTTLPIDARVHLDIHPTHPSAVTAVLTGTQAHIAHLGLEAADWTVVADNVLVLVRIDHEEPYWAQDAAKHLTAGGITVEITPRLQEAMDEEWTWANYPMPWCTRSEIREVSNEAQKIHDDIRHSQLLIHAHAHDGHTTVAVGTYLGRNGKSVYLHGEDHLRQVADTFDSPAGAMLAFEKVHGAEMRPGPAPHTDTERAAAETRTPLALTAAKPEPARPEPQTVPAYLADAGDHDALFDTFLDAHDEWEKWRTWTDDTSYAVHESQTLRIERIHEADPREAAWTVAAYETPVSDRMWHLTATGTTPAPVLQALVHHLAEGDAWDTAIGSPVDEKTVTAATKPLTDAGWKHTVDGRWLRWTNPSGDVGIQFDAFAAQTPNSTLATWTIWAGPSIDHPTWTVTASPYAPSVLLADLAENLAHGTGPRTYTPLEVKHPAHLATAPTGPPHRATTAQSSRTR
ncbi:DUF317 domain-containing protein [Streptomyces scabiei]|uniref:DUF317 domain-containing protein n=2 Tax=Streptomyces scabiei TaxID=1930 RepID=UPI000765C276|nr:MULTISPECIES: DUF317 domain-containing protein [Streptomyces]MBP5870421.1 DUF317 domain-containing protein [Streptomyces sp. LBUM 1485]MDW8476346.1 DUF317 domain-containing protein [Streptomyces scabiei]MDX2569340.1 DUF317 domain-containing protein [Streptomyces scabiei]MDX3151263.1 DUF317 domain-containing protein [Streptomyces scabiei]MDX3159281.1 DUF317 domain-containing protein [Streptomyces scabiei]